MAEVEKLDRRVLPMECDTRSSADLDAAVAAGMAEFGRIDILVANAGIWALGRLWELTDEQWQDVIDINLTGAWRSVKAVVPTMIESAPWLNRADRLGERLRGQRRHDPLRGRQARRARADEERGA